MASPFVSVGISAQGRFRQFHFLPRRYPGVECSAILRMDQNEEQSAVLNCSFTIESGDLPFTLPAGAKYLLSIPLPANWQASDVHVQDAQGNPVAFEYKDGKIILKNVQGLGPYRLIKAENSNPDNRIGFMPLIGESHETHQLERESKQQEPTVQKTTSGQKIALPKTGETRQPFDVVLLVLAGFIFGGLGSRIVRKRKEI